RIISLSDGIFAFAMTLMVLQFDLPSPDTVAAGELRRDILDQWPALFSYAVSYFVIANYWIVHHRMFRLIRTHDAWLMWINVAFLFSISFLPFPTDVMGEYRDQPFAIVFYALAMAATSLLSTVEWWYVSNRRRLLVSGVTRELARYHLLRGICVMTVFLVSAVLARIDTTLAQFSWLALFPVLFALSRVYRDALTDSSSA
ncbi:MAG: TMEM175 family protein, partial [Dehalococcoidia bacterium]